MMKNPLNRPLKRFSSQIANMVPLGLPLPDFDSQGHAKTTEEAEKNPIPISSHYGPHRYVSVDTIKDLFEMKFAAKFEKVVFFDCRLPVQYERSHIVSAINLVTMKQMISIYHSLEFKKCCFIFYDSSNKAMKWMELFRNYDRSMNIGGQPPYIFSDIYICDAAFEEIEKSCKGIVTPVSPQNIDKPLDAERLKKESRRFKEEMKNLDKLFIVPRRAKPPLASLSGCRALYKCNSQPNV